MKAISTHFYYLFRLCVYLTQAVLDRTFLFLLMYRFHEIGFVSLNGLTHVIRQTVVSYISSAIITSLITILFHSIYILVLIPLNNQNYNFSS